jgi:HK97 family phage portal protein
MANFITKVIDKSIDRIARKSQSINFYPANKKVFSLFGGVLSNREYADLETLIKYFECHPLVFEVIDNVSQNVSHIPLKITTSRDSEKALANSRILEMLPADIRYQVVASIESCGNAFLYFRKGIGMGEEVEFWYAPNVTITTSTVTGEVTKYCYYDEHTGTYDVQGEDLQYVLHLKNPQISQHYCVDLGFSKLQGMMDVVESSKEKFIAEKSIFKNKGVSGLIVSKTDIPLLEPDRKAQQADFDERIGGAQKFGGVALTSNDVNFLPIGMSPTDLKMLEGIVSDLRRLCSAYNLSSVLFNDVANSKFDNMEEAEKQAYINCYIPTAEKIYPKIFEWLSELLNIDEIPNVDKTKIEVIKSSTNVVAMALKDFDIQVQRDLVSQMTTDEARELLTLGALPQGQTVIGKNGNTQSNGEGSEEGN